MKKRHLNPLCTLDTVGPEGRGVRWCVASCTTSTTTNSRCARSDPGWALHGRQCGRAGQVVLQLNSPYRDGTTHIVISPLQLMQRLAALVPRPRLHLMRFHGLLAPHAKLSPRIVPSAPLSAAQPCDHHAPGAHAQAPARIGWACSAPSAYSISISSSARAVARACTSSPQSSIPKSSSRSSRTCTYPPAPHRAHRRSPCRCSSRADPLHPSGSTRLQRRARPALAQTPRCAAMTTTSTQKQAAQPHRTARFQVQPYPVDRFRPRR